MELLLDTRTKMATFPSRTQVKNARHEFTLQMDQNVLFVTGTLPQVTLIRICVVTTLRCHYNLSMRQHITIKKLQPDYLHIHAYTKIDGKNNMQ